MKFMCALSVTVRLALLAFAFGLVLGIAVGYRATGARHEPDRTPAAVTPLAAAGGPSSLGWFN